MNRCTGLSLTTACLAVGLLAPQTANAATVTSLPATPTDTFNSLGTLTGIPGGAGGGSSFHQADYAPLVDVDGLDATFALTVTLEAFSTSDRQTIWEAGAAQIGTAVTYEAGNVLVLSLSGNAGGRFISATSAPLSPGTYDLIWTMQDLGASGSPTSPTIALYIDGVLADSATGSSWNTDWSGTNNSGLGEQAGAILNTFATATNGTSVPFSDGSIDLTRGLEFYADTVFIPEPGSLALLGLGGLFLARRRRNQA
ncbi:MAG: PEP-CTERM sorting domain-containing protein [Planctomycetota bacterium]